MLKKNWCNLEFPSDPKNVAFARTAIALFAAQLEFTLDELEDLKVAVSEAVSNSVIHGYKSELGLIKINLAHDENQLMVVIEDFGEGIADLEQAKETGYSSMPEERMGLGFTFMYEYMDQVEVETEVAKGTKITLIKKVSISHGAN